MAWNSTDISSGRFVEWHNNSTRMNKISQVIVLFSWSITNIFNSAAIIDTGNILLWLEICNTYMEKMVLIFINKCYKGCLLILPALILSFIKLKKIVDYLISETVYPFSKHSFWSNFATISFIIKMNNFIHIFTNSKDKL